MFTKQNQNNDQTSDMFKIEQGGIVPIVATPHKGRFDEFSQLFFNFESLWGQLPKLQLT